VALIGHRPPQGSRHPWGSRHQASAEFALSRTKEEH